MGLPWVRLDTSFHHNQKIIDLVSAGKWRCIACYIASLAHCGQHQTDGFVAESSTLARGRIALGLVGRVQLCQRHADSIRHGTHPHSSKTHCPAGHAYSTENTYWSSRSDGRRFRVCRTCQRNYVRKDRRVA